MALTSQVMGLISPIMALISQVMTLISIIIRGVSKLSTYEWPWRCKMDAPELRGGGALTAAREHLNIPWTRFYTFLT